MHDETAHLLVVDDDAALRSSLGTALRYEGYDVTEASDGADALELLGAAPYDLVVLDIGMPHIDGLSVCRALRRRGEGTTPVLMLTARTATSDRVGGLDAGADDYVAKPFVLDELFARVRALLRRSRPISSPLVTVDDLTIDLSSRAARRAGRSLDLTKTEFDLLALLAERTGRVQTRDDLYSSIWGYDFETSSRSLDVYVSYLRSKLEAGGEPRMIHTVRGVGFVLRTAP